MLWGRAMKTFTCLNSHLYRTFQRACTSGIISLVRTSKRNVLVPFIIAIVFTFMGQQGRACMINITAVNFGSYDVFSNAATVSTGNIDVNCASGDGYIIAISAGSGTYSQRAMISGTHTLNYNLYTAANRAVVWGGSTSGTTTVSGSGTGESVNHVVYGRVPPHQNIPAGNYRDTITVVIFF